MRIQTTILATFSIVLIVSTTKIASAHCPGSAECVTEAEAKERIEDECEENRNKWKRCKRELDDRNNTEAQIQKCKGQLEECRKSNKEQARIIRHEDKATTRLNKRLSERPTVHDVFNWTIVGAGVSGLACAALAKERNVQNIGFCFSATAAAASLKGIYSLFSDSRQ